NGSWEETKEGQIVKKVFDLITQLTDSTVSLRTIDFKQKKVWITTQEAPEGILLDLISQGFKKIFGWIGYFVMRMSEANEHIDDFTKAYAIVFIDEIATYLHPKWQSKIIRLLVDNFPNVQFIISTHSPLVVNSLRTDEVSIIQIKSNNSEITAQLITKNIYGADINTVLEEIMDTPERPIEIKIMFNELFQLIEEQELEKAEKKYAELKSIISSTDNDLQRADMLMETWRILNS
ncbi:MAG: AAA family ATPase, partial [Saprospiraceae bacterium]